MDNKRKKERYYKYYQIKQGLTNVAISSMNDEKNRQYYLDKRSEIDFIKAKYGMDSVKVANVFKLYLSNASMPSGSIDKITKLLEVILKNLYDYTDEEIREYFVLHYYLFKYPYDDIYLKVVLFYNFNLLEDVIFKDTYYLNKNFPRETINSREIYAILMNYNIKSMVELKDKVKSIYDEELIKMTRKYPLTQEIIEELTNKFLLEVKESWQLELKNSRI